MSRAIAYCAAIGAAAASLWLTPAEAAESTPPGATVESVVALAKRVNPTVAAAALEFEAATRKIGTAGVLADPDIVLEAWDVNSRGVSQRRFGFEQDIKLWNKYGLERGIARSDAEAAKFQGQASVIDLVSQVVIAHAEYNAAFESVNLSTDIKRRYDDILALLRSRYGNTTVDQQDVIKAEIEDATAEGDLLRKQGELKAAAARLNVLIGRGVRAPLASPKGFRSLRTLTLAQAAAKARASNPVLALAGAQTESAAQTKSLADLNYYPDISVGAKYVQRPGTEDTGEFGLRFKLPLHTEVKDAEQQAAFSNLSAAQARKEALRLKIDGQIADAWFSVDALRKVIQIYETRELPPARTSVENARNGFRAGSSDITLLFETERRFQTIQLDLLKLKTELQAKYAEMERLAGGAL